MLPIEFTLAWRYFRSKRRHPFIGLISGISVLGVALGVAALIIVLAVMSGFERDLVERIVGTYAHTVVEGGGGFEPSDELTRRIRGASAHIRAVAPFVQAQAMIQKNGRSRGVVVKGSRRTDEESVSLIAQYLKEGRYPEEGTKEILIGDALSRLIGARTGQKIQFLSPEGNKRFRLTVSGLFHSGMYDYDCHLVYLPLDLSQDIFRIQGRVNGLAVTYDDARRAVENQRQLQRHLGFDFYVRTWRDMNQTLFGALKLEKAVMFVILALIVMVACFNIVGTLTLLVMDKTKDIGILKALGAARGRIMRVFMLSGAWIGAAGMCLGLCAGAGVCVLLEKYPLIKIPSDIYYFDRLPVDLRWADAGGVAVCAMVLTFLSTLYPAWTGSRMQAVEALRYE